MANILVLEDDANLRELLAATLEEAGHRTREAGWAQEAIELAQAEPFDLVVSDVRMAGSPPGGGRKGGICGMDGIEALAAIKKMHPRIRAIVITGYADEAAPPRAIRLLVDDYVYKPFHLKDFLKLVERVLGTPDEEVRHQSMLSRLRQSASSLLAKVGLAPKDESPAAALEYERDQAFQSFFVGLRSGHLKKPAALDVYDQLEALEESRREPAQVHRLIDGYRRVREVSVALAEAQSTGMRKARAPRQITPPDFYRFYERVQDHSITLVQLKVAPVLRQWGREAVAHDPESAALYDLLWS